MDLITCKAFILGETLQTEKSGVALNSASGKCGVEELKQRNTDYDEHFL